MVFHQSAQFGFLPCLLVVFLDRLGVARTTFVEGYCPSFEIRGQEVLLAENSWIGLLGFKPFAPQGDALGFEFSSLWVTVPGVGFTAGLLCLSLTHLLQCGVFLVHPMYRNHSASFWVFLEETLTFVAVDLV